MRFLLSCIVLMVFGVAVSTAEQPTVLFDGKQLDHWEYNDGGWAIDDEGAMYCRLETVTAKDGTERQKSMGYIWTRQSYGDFELSLSYKLSAATNSGVFFRTDKENPVQGGFEIQLLDDSGFQQLKGKKNAKNLNGAFYDAQAASSSPAKPVGQWNRLTLRCQGPRIQLSINGVLVNDVNVDKWTTVGQNPDGSPNKFKTALKDLPRQGRIGFQNHGQVVWFKDVTIERL